VRGADVPESPARQPSLYGLDELRCEQQGIGRKRKPVPASVDDMTSPSSCRRPVRGLTDGSGSTARRLVHS
jgi:hypothetical protein